MIRLIGRGRGAGRVGEAGPNARLLDGRRPSLRARHPARCAGSGLRDYRDKIFHWPQMLSTARCMRCGTQVPLDPGGAAAPHENPLSPSFRAR